MGDGAKFDCMPESERETKRKKKGKKLSGDNGYAIVFNALSGAVFPGYN